MHSPMLYVVVIGIVIILVASRSGPASYDALARRGIPARGILLQVSSVAVSIKTGARRFERRAVVMDVEVPGQVTYEISVSPLIPSNLARDILPGATVELRVNRRKPTEIAIVGPGAGFAVAALNAAPAADQRMS